VDLFNRPGKLFRQCGLRRGCWLRLAGRKAGRGFGRNLKRQQKRERKSSALHDILDFLEDSAFGGTSALSPLQQFNEAQNQFSTTLSGAQTGNIDALENLPDVARQLLEEGREFYGSSQGFANLFTNINQALSGLVGGEGLLSLQDSVDAGTQKQIDRLDTLISLQSATLTQNKKLLAELRSLNASSKSIN